MERGSIDLSASAWSRARQGVQVLALLLFLYLLLETRQNKVTILPHDLFFRLNPLVGITAMLAERRWIGPLVLGAVTLVLTLALGRAWCGWLCPMGTLLDWTRLRRPHPSEEDLPSGWRQVKHFVLFSALFASLLGSLTLLVLDPITLLFRTVAVAVLPALDVLVTALERTLYNIDPLQGPVERFDALIRGTVFPAEQHFFQQNVFLALVLAAILALNAVRPRFWCRYLCPLGALLGLISKMSWLRHEVDKKACIECGRCARICPTGTVSPNRGFAADPAECILCLDCLDTCPTNAVSFASLAGQAGCRDQRNQRNLWSRFRRHVGSTEWLSYDPSRRQALASLGIALVGVGLFRSAPIAGRDNPWLIRPPGARENSLLSKCIRCGECLTVCPTAGLQPSLFTAGWEGLWTPVLVPRTGYCDYSCNSCGHVCPTGAIPPLSLEDKRKDVIGLAYIDRNRCIPWDDLRDCIVCEEMCPVPEKAIVLEKQTLIDAQGQSVTVRRPHVIRERCIGCGICETKCPLNGDAAIRVHVPNSR